MSLTEVAVAVFGSSVLIVPIILFLAKIWFSAEIERSIKLRYDTRFEDHRRQSQTEHEAKLQELQAEHDAKLQELQAEHDAKLQELQSAYTVTNEAFIQGQAAAIERRIKATVTLWEAVLDLKGGRSGAARLLNVLTPDEYDLMRTNPEYRRQVVKGGAMKDHRGGEKLYHLAPLCSINVRANC